jgi:hypothetical protein
MHPHMSRRRTRFHRDRRRPPVDARPLEDRKLRFAVSRLATYRSGDAVRRRSFLPRSVCATLTPLQGGLPRAGAARYHLSGRAAPSIILLQVFHQTKQLRRAVKGRTGRRAEEARQRRLEIFRVWSEGGSFREVGEKFGLSRVRANQIVWKAIVWDGARSDRAREYAARLDSDGYWLKRYDQGFSTDVRP